MSNPWDSSLEYITDHCLSSRLSTEQSLEAMENVRDYAEEWVDALKDDLAAGAAEGGT